MDIAVSLNKGRKEYRVTWFIENYSYCKHNNGEKLTSPEFTAEGLNGTTWNLQLYPRGQTDLTRNNVSLYLNRCETDKGPEIMPLKVELSFLNPDGSALILKDMEYTFKRGSGRGWGRFAQIDVFLKQKADFLPQDRLCVHCVVWKGEGNVQSVTQFTALTRIRIEHMCFLHAVEGFSALKSNEKKTMLTKSPSGDELLSSSVHFSDDFCKGKIMVEILPSCSELTLTKCKLSVLDLTGKLIDCCKVDNRFICTRNDIKKLPLSLSRTVIVNKKQEYLPGDKLSLLCDCTFSAGIEFEKIEMTLYELPSVAVNLISTNDQNKDAYNAAEKHSTCPGVQDDLKALYNNLFHTDMELKTKTKSFPAHKIVLCARSSVFKAMLTSDMKEKNLKRVHIDDLENDTIEQLMLFLYSDDLEDLQWESAIKLYYAGDKYNIGKLKVLCSSFLVDNLSTSNAIELLLLADRHNDSDFRKLVENFILEHEEEVFGSDEWEKLIEINSQLVSRTMHLKYKRNKGVHNVGE